MFTCFREKQKLDVSIWKRTEAIRISQRRKRLFSFSLSVLVSVFLKFRLHKIETHFWWNKRILYLYRQLDANESNTLEMEVWPLNKLAQLQPHLKPCGRCVCRAIGIIKPKYSMPMHSLRQLDFGRAPLWCCVTNRISLTRITYQKYASILLRCFAVSYTQNTSIHNSPYRNRNRKHFKIEKVDSDLTLEGTKKKMEKIKQNYKRKSPVKGSVSPKLSLILSLCIDAMATDELAFRKTNWHLIQIRCILLFAPKKSVPIT